MFFFETCQTWSPVPRVAAQSLWRQHWDKSSGYPPREPRKHIPRNAKVRKIIDSKVPAGRGYVVKPAQQLQIDGWKTTFLLRRPIFRCYVSSQEVIFCKLHHRRPQTVAQIIKEILETSPEHGHGIPANMGDKLGDKTVDKRKTKPGRRTRHPSQGGRQERKQEKANTREANTASQPRQTHLRQH